MWCWIVLDVDGVANLGLSLPLPSLPNLHVCPYVHIRSANKSLTSSPAPHRTSRPSRTNSPSTASRNSPVPSRGASPMPSPSARTASPGMRRLLTPRKPSPSPRARDDRQSTITQSDSDSRRTIAGVRGHPLFMKGIYSCWHARMCIEPEACWLSMPLRSGYLHHLGASWCAATGVPHSAVREQWNACQI